MSNIYSYISESLEHLYQNAMDYLHEEYHSPPTELIDIPLSEEEVGEILFYEAMASDITDCTGRNTPYEDSMTGDTIGSQDHSSPIPIGKLVV